jgi:hypothetical protein
MSSNWGMPYTVKKDLFEGYKVLPLHAPNSLDLRKKQASKILGQ